MSEMERRFTPVPVQVRAESGHRKIGGYAAMFDKLSRNLGGFVEVVTPSFFNHTRANGWPDVICRYNHDDNMLLGTTGGNTLRLWTDETGLVYEVDPPASRADIVELIERGDVRKSSFAFRVDSKGDEWTLTDQDYPLRKLTSGQLVDVAPVNMPAYESTSAGMRNLDVALASLAARMEADPAEVRKLAQENDLKRFFVRTDIRGASTKPKVKPKKTLLGAAAALELLARREDPYA
jgi:HK97 family phage prohead protease